MSSLLILKGAASLLDDMLEQAGGERGPRARWPGGHAGGCWACLLQALVMHSIDKEAAVAKQRAAVKQRRQEVLHLQQHQRHRPGAPGRRSRCSHLHIGCDELAVTECS